MNADSATIWAETDGPCEAGAGDVHHAYVARADLPGAPVHQLTCSPVHNTVPWYTAE
ncbi:hypothetical protein [Amycolatopsis sp. SID8362]|uniref:hypothetical protein n=1 Tax=Amycolatopsis sp. SID8362 TaxID=2690346 RepID=UPI0019433B2A|nr:hypothetical protein [Amycolatopsis sp. SID8362]